MLYRKILIGLLAFLPILLQAQFRNAVQWNIYPDNTQSLEIGDEVTLVFEASIDPGFHIYSAFPPEDFPSLGTSLGLDETSTGVSISGVLNEEGDKHTKFDEIFETTISYFEDKVIFKQKVKIDAALAKAEGFLRFQVCDTNQCIPGSQDFSFDFQAQEKAVANETEESKQDEALFQPVDIQQSAEVSELNSSTKTEATAEEKPLLAQLDSRPSSGIKEPVKWQVQLSPSNDWQVGDTLSLAMSAKIDETFYLYSSIPPKDPANLPTTLDLDESSIGIRKLGELEELGDRKQKFDNVFETDIQYFTKEVTFKQRFVVEASPSKLEGYLSYQVCDDETCVPAKQDFSFGEATQTTSNASSSAFGGDNGEDENLLAILLESILWGFTALFTPCVFPMIPLTVSFFTKQQEGRSRAEGIRQALIYGASIVFIYTVLGLLLSIIVGPEAMQRIANNPYVNVAFFALLFVFGLSFLGMFEITLPSSWSTALGKKGSQGGLIGIFFMALTLAVVSFSCTAPIVSGALFRAVDSGAYLGPTLAMMGFSTALALPFVLFAMFPGWLESLPRSGGWLNAVKVNLGFIEIALAFTYLSQADLIWHWGLLDREIMIGLFIVIFTLMGMYLLGKIMLPHDSPIERLSVPRLLLAISVFWFVLYLVPGLWGAPLRMLAGFLPKSNDDMGVLLINGQTVAGGPTAAIGSDICNYPGKKYAELNKETPKGFCAFYDLEQGLAYAKEHHKPVFLDFTGHTCKNCRHVEQNVWPNAEVRRYLTEEYVLISLYTDDGTRLESIEVNADGKKLRTVGDKWLQYQIDTYRSNTQPEYIILDHNNEQLLPSLGYTLDIQEYIGYLQEGVDAYQAKHVD